MLVPKYEGADAFRVLPIPLASAHYGRVSVDSRGVTLNVFSPGDFSFDLRGGYELGRYESDSDDLKGLGDIGFAGVVGGIASYNLGPVKFYGSLDRTIGGSEGLVARFGVNATHTYDRFTLSAGVSATWADDKYMRAYFGVTPEQSARSGLSTFNANAGFKRADFTTSTTYMISEHWLVRGQAGVGYLLGDAANSPIVKDKLQPSGMLSIGYKF
ncbi:MltA-interacting MipA family protein [Rhodopseudomonas palustris]|uniref:MltA-interacting MipA family protein n=2 Tax=Nitrobacteraceae TaxID=41294 RepID=A0A0D7E204_RHOPL|nr:MltA-interacting MipA family protein [Rhodopseudomonas palustris]